MMRTLTPFLSGIIAVLLFLFFTQPRYEEIKKVQDEIASYEVAVQKYTDFSRKLNDKLAIKAKYQGLKIDRLERLVPDTVDAARLLVDLESLAKKHKMLFGNIATSDSDVKLTPSASTDGSDPVGVTGELSSTDISFEVIGTYEQFKSLLRDIESSLTIFEVTGIAFAATEGSFQQFAVTVRTYALSSDN